MAVRVPEDNSKAQGLSPQLAQPRDDRAARQAAFFATGRDA